MGILQPPDAYERLAVEAVLDQRPEEAFGRTFHRLKRFTWGEGKSWRGTHEPGQRYAVDIVLDGSRYNGQTFKALPGGRVVGTLVVVMPLVCIDAQQAAIKIPPDEHRHDDATCRYHNDPDMPVYRAWQFLSLQDAVLAALRWEPESETEPFGWHRALDGTNRIRPGGDPLQEVTTADALERRT